MAGDIPLQERLILLGEPSGPKALQPEAVEKGRALHVYGDRVRILEQELIPKGVPGGEEPTDVSLEGLSDTEALGVSAFMLRQSQSYARAKRQRPRQGETWDFRAGGCIVPTPGGVAADLAKAAAPTSAYLEGTVAVGIIIVAGPTAATQFSAAERTKVVAEVQNGLSFYASTNPRAGLTFVYDIQFVTLSVPPDPSAPDLEGLWRDPAMAALGFPATWASVGQYIEGLRTTFKTRWSYCAFFTKYPVFHFAYASIGGPRLVMQYDNDGWGPDNIDRVFAHETGHIFMCPDEYAASGCDCGGSWGRWGKPNSNCERCAPSGGFPCIMKVNSWEVCTVTPAHVGWVAQRIFAKNSGKALDVTGASMANGAQVIQWAYHGGENQQFSLDRLADGSYRFVARHSGKVLDVSGASMANGAPLIQWDWHGGNNQRFLIEHQSDGRVRVVAKHSGKVLDITGSSGANGAQLIQWDWHGGDNQRFLITAPITARHSGKVLDVAGASTANGAQLIQWEYHGGGNQIFRAEPVGGGYVRFVDQHSGKVLDIAGGSTANGAQLIQWDWHGGDNQRFRLEALGDGHTRVIAKHSGKVLDVAGVSVANGAPIIQWDWHGGDNQRWLVPLW
ncbi:RICIN domain-containing protein [Myxococcaceae bacterium GXIMD 01537]